MVLGRLESAISRNRRIVVRGWHGLQPLGLLSHSRFEFLGDRLLGPPCLYCLIQSCEFALTCFQFATCFVDPPVLHAWSGSLRERLQSRIIEESISKIKIEYIHIYMLESFCNCCGRIRIIEGHPSFSVGNALIWCSFQLLQVLACRHLCYVFKCRWSIYACCLCCI